MKSAPVRIYIITIIIFNTAKRNYLTSSCKSSSLSAEQITAMSSA